MMKRKQNGFEQNKIGQGVLFTTVLSSRVRITT